LNITQIVVGHDRSRLKQLRQTTSRSTESRWADSTVMIADSVTDDRWFPELLQLIGFFQAGKKRQYWTKNVSFAVNIKSYGNWLIGVRISTLDWDNGSEFTSGYTKHTISKT
jgi:hypothetical protein